MAWWDFQEVASGEGLSWQLGPFGLDAFRGPDAWWLWTRRRELAEGQPADCRLEPLPRMPPEEGGERFVFRRTPARIRLRPRLADRPVVVRSRQPVFVPAGEEATIYLSTPIWLVVEVGEPATLLSELAGERLSDTWFGPSTREGELCYAGRTHARNQLAAVPRRVHRAITPVTVLNQASTPLPLEKINLPVPLLAVYGDANLGLWTEAVQLTREPVRELATLRVLAGAPTAAPGAQLLSPARREPGRGGLVRAFSDFFA